MGNLSIHEPTIYRAVIDDVVAAIKSEFDEYGVGEDVLADLQEVCMVCATLAKYFVLFVFSPHLVSPIEMGGQSHGISRC